MVGPQQKKVLRDLWRSRLLFSAVVVLLIFGVGMFIAIYSAFQDLRASEKGAYDLTHFADATFDLGLVPQAAAADAQGVAGVAAAEGRIVQDVPIVQPGGTSTVTARLISVPDTGRPAINDVVMREGSYPADGDTSSVLIDDQFAGAYGLKPGDSIELVINGTQHTFTIAGTVTSPEYIWKAKSAQQPFIGKGEFAIVIARQSLVDSLLGTTGEINQVIARYDAGANASVTTAAIATVLAKYGVQQITPRADQISYALLMLDLNGFNKIGVFAPALFLLISALVIYALLARTIQGQRSIIGMMRAVGFSRGQVLRHFLTFSLVIATLGGVLGSVVGTALGWYITKLYVDTIGIPTLRVGIHWPVIVIGLAIGYAVCIAAGAGPALGASRLPPSEAMRPSPASSHRSAWLELLIRLLRPPYTIKLSLRNMARARGRTLSSALGIAMSVALVVAAIGMMDSMNHGLSVQFDQTRQYDLKAFLVQPVPVATLTDYASWGEVTSADPVLELPVTLTAGQNTQNVQMMGIASDTQSLHLQRDTGATPLSTNGLYLSSGLAHKLGVKVGDSLTVAFGTKVETMRLDGTVAIPMSSGAYVAKPQADALAGAPIATGVLLRLRSAADTTAVRDRLAQEPNVLSIESPSQERHSFEQLMSLFYEFVGIFVIFGVALGVIAVFNTVMINVVERRQELATMRTLGFGRWTVDGLLTTEDLLAGAMGALLGMVLGYILEQRLLSLFDSSLFSLPVYISPTTYAIVGVASLVLIILSQAPGLRVVNHLDLATVSKERAS